MKRLEQINDARGRLAQRIKTPGLSDQQKLLVVGMVNALVWVADGEADSTMLRMLSDEPMAVGKTLDDVGLRTKAVLHGWNTNEVIDA